MLCKGQAVGNLRRVEGSKIGLCKKRQDETLMIPAGTLQSCGSRSAEKKERQINQR